MINEEKQLSTNNISTTKSVLSTGKFIAIVAAGVIAVVGVGYLSMSLFLSNRFYFGTVINGVNCSGKTVGQAQTLIEEKAEKYTLTIAQRNNNNETINSEEINLKIDITDSLNEIKNVQTPYKWGLYLFKENNNDTAVNVSYDEEKLNEKLNSLDCLNTEKMISPTNAVVEYNEDNKKFEVTKEDNGTTVKIEETKTAIIDSIKNLNETLNLEENNLYNNAEFTSDDEKLKSDAEIMNKYALVTITYNFGDKSEIVDKDKIKDWLIIKDNGEVDFDKDKVDKFVQYLAKTYNTFGITRSFVSSYNSHTVTVVGGDYGWWLNKSAESNSLIEAIKAGNDIVKEPVYLQKAASYGKNDIGNTYAEVNLGTQHMFFYKDGVKVLESDFVSGKPSNGHATPTGTYSVTYKELDAVLRGENYATPVKYWMPFNKDVGFHDATWQSSFGGKRYLTHGSHGCINLPFDTAKQLYSYIAKGYPVVVYDYIPTAADLAAVNTTTEVLTEANTVVQTTTQQQPTTKKQAVTETTTKKTVVTETTTKKQVESETITTMENITTNSPVQVIVDDTSPVLPELN